MTYKVGEGPNSNPEFTSGTTHSTANSQSGPEQSGTTANRIYSHDNTPLRQRELETLGNNTRTRVEGNSPGNSEFGHSHNPKHSGNSKSEGGLGLSLSGELGGVEIGANVRLNNATRALRLGAVNDIRYRNTPEGFQYTRSNDGPSVANNLRDGAPRPNFRTDSDVRPELRNNNGSNDVNKLLRDTIKDLRHELNALRHDSHHGRGHSDHRPLGFNERQIEHFLQIATRDIDNRLGRGDSPERIAQQLKSDISGVVRFSEHFSHLERVGGEPVRRAYESVLRMALNLGETESNRLPFLAEVLRDLSRGAFLHPRDIEGPFPLTGRARIVSEMMELLRTLEAIDKFLAEAKAAPYGKFNGGDLSLFSFGRIPNVVDVELAEALAKAFANLGPTLPGMAGRIEILQMVAALNGMLTDAAGRPLIMMDGLPLKLGELLWFNGRPEALFDMWSGDRFSTRLFPTLLHGFDAVYSLMGFDGRSLSLPHFVAIQSQINASEFEWFFGQAPLSEGWLRSVIEFLKDSISFDHNVLGEMLEEALTNSRFHVAVMRGTVEDGTAVNGSFTFEPVPIG